MLALKIALVFMTIICVVMIGVIFHLSNRKKTPISGELASRTIINLKITSPVYQNFDDETRIALLGSYLSRELEINSSLIIPLQYYAVSENGRFCIHVNGNKYWVDPGDNFNYYVCAKINTSSSNSSKATTSKASNSSTCPKDGLTGK